MTRGRKQKRQESTVWKRFMDTIISQLPKYIKKYPPEEQRFLNDFLMVLIDYNVDIIAYREKLSKNFQEFIRRYENTSEYLQFPFLWFAVGYFQNAGRLLRNTSFQAENFYGYLVQYLRGDSDSPGAFHLIRKMISLKNIMWEQLQYTCAKLRVPLTNEELQILETIVSHATEARINTLNPQRLKSVIVNQLKSSKISRNLTNFLTIVDGRWNLWFASHAFDLKRLYFSFQINESFKLEDIIDFQNNDNTILTTSRVWQVRSFPRMYSGFIVISSQQMQPLINYLSKVL